MAAPKEHAADLQTSLLVNIPSLVIHLPDSYFSSHSCIIPTEVLIWLLTLYLFYRLSTPSNTDCMYTTNRSSIPSRFVPSSAYSFGVNFCINDMAAHCGTVFELSVYELVFEFERVALQFDRLNKRSNLPFAER